jgi:ABC-type nitrate/sulfonate/bicarbonate transport system substrate-binding protein
MSKPIRVGLLRLVDSAPVIIAEANGLFREQGIDVQISIEPSWSNIADKLTYGVLDAAVMLPPLALAACAGLRGPKARLVVPMSLSQGGNAIAASNQAAASLTENGSQPPGPVAGVAAASNRPAAFRGGARFLHAQSAAALLVRVRWCGSGPGCRNRRDPTGECRRGPGSRQYHRLLRRCTVG